MPWKRAKALPPPDNTLFEACFRIQREACEAAGRHIPMVVENVRGAQKWVGRARWNFGSFYLWGDVPALMPPVKRLAKNPGLDWSAHADPDYRESGKGACFRDTAIKNTGGSWFVPPPGRKCAAKNNPDGRVLPGTKQHGSGATWWDKALDENPMRHHSSGSTSRKFASAMIAKIPLPLSRHIARVMKP